MRIKKLLQMGLVIASLAGATVYADSFPHPPVPRLVIPVVHVSHGRRHHRHVRRVVVHHKRVVRRHRNN